MVRAGVAAALVALTFAGAASAEEPALGSRLRPRDDSVVRAPDDATREGHRFMQCIVSKRAPLARRWLDATENGDVTAYGTTLFREVTCNSLATSTMFDVGRRMNFDQDLGRGMVAEALLAAAPRPTMPTLPLERVHTSSWNAFSGRHAVVDDMVVCVAATNPSGTVALLAIEAMTPPEAAAMRDLAPSFGRCLSVEAKLTANRPSMRAARAEALYHRINPVALATVVPERR